MILFWEYSRVSGSIADDSIKNDLFLWVLEWGLALTNCSDLWANHQDLESSHPAEQTFQHFPREICKIFDFFFLDFIRSCRPWKLLIKKKEKEIFLLNENDVQWTLSTLPWTRPGRSLEESPVVQRWHCCDENQIVFILNVADEGLLKWFLCSPYIRSQQACHRALWCDLPETKDNILG